MRPTPRRAADGSTEEPLPSAVPTDADHIATPRDLRAERLAVGLVGRTGHRHPRTIAARLAVITDTTYSREDTTMHQGTNVRLDFSTQHSMRRVHEAHRYYEGTGHMISAMSPEEWVALIGLMASYASPEEFRIALRHARSLDDLARALRPLGEAQFRHPSEPVPMADDPTFSIEAEEWTQRHLPAGEGADR